MGIDNFSKNNYQIQQEKLVDYIDLLLNDNHVIGFFFDATLIKLSYNTDLTCWIETIKTILDIRSDTSSKIIIVEDNSDFRSFGKICQSIHRPPANLAFHQTHFDKNEYTISTTNEMASNMDNLVNCTNYSEANIDGDLSIIHLVDRWRSTSPKHFCIIVSRDQDFLYYYLGERNVICSFLNLNAGEIFLQREKFQAENILEIKLTTLFQKHDFNQFNIKFNGVDFAVMNNVFLRTPDKHDYLIAMIEYMVCILHSGTFDLVLRQSIIGNILRFCTFLVRKDTEEIGGIIEKYKRPPTGVVLIESLNKLCSFGELVLHGVALELLSWVSIADKRRYSNIITNLENNFTSVRREYNQANKSTKYAINVDVVDFDQLTLVTRSTLFFFGVEYFFNIINKMNRWVNICESLNADPFDGFLVFFEKLCVLISKLADFLEVDLLKIQEEYDLVAFLSASSIWLIKKYGIELNRTTC